MSEGSVRTRLDGVRSSERRHQFWAAIYTGMGAITTSGFVENVNSGNNKGIMIIGTAACAVVAIDEGLKAFSDSRTAAALEAVLAEYQLTGIGHEGAESSPVA